MDFALEERDGIVIVTLPKVDLHEYCPFEQYAEGVRKVVEDNLSRNIIVDLSQVSFSATPLLATLVWAHLAASRRGRKFAICSSSDFILEVFRKVRLSRLFRLFPSREEAIEAMKAPGDFYGHEH